MFDRIDQDQNSARVFLLEDVYVNALVLTEYLAKLGLKDVVWVKTLAEAEDYVEPLGAGEFFVAFLDVMLPDGECWALATRLIGQGGVPICAYTARVAQDDLERFETLGFDHVLPKPIRKEDLAQFIDKYKKKME